MYEVTLNGTDGVASRRYLVFAPSGDEAANWILARVTEHADRDAGS